MIKNNIKNILEQKGISIKKFSRDLDIAYANAHDLVNREDLSHTQLETLLEAAKYLDVSIERLYEDQG